MFGGSAEALVATMPVVARAQCAAADVEQMVVST
jgi:hypothetical protein